jgi:hypothetical protein
VDNWNQKSYTRINAKKLPCAFLIRVVSRFFLHELNGCSLPHCPRLTLAAKPLDGFLRCQPNQHVIIIDRLAHPLSETRHVEMSVYFEMSLTYF